MATARVVSGNVVDPDTRGTEEHLTVHRFLIDKLRVRDWVHVTLSQEASR
jgi:hypothetical protein